MLFKKHFPVSVDIGSSYVKIARIVKSKQGWELNLFDSIYLPHGTISDGIIEDRGIVTSAIKELLEKNKIKSTDAILGVAGHSSVIIKRIPIPNMKEEDLANSIKIEAEQYIPFDINDVNIDFQILGKNRDDSGLMDVVLIAVKKNVIKDYADVVENAGLTPIIVDIAHFAVGNIFEHNYGVLENDCVALVNVGANSSNLNIIKNGVPLFTRDTPTGGNVQTEALMSEFSVSFEDAERLKKGLSVDGVQPENASFTILSSSEEIFRDIHRSMDFFRSSVSDEDIAKIVISGGVVLIKGFANAMSERLGMPVEILDPFKNITISDSLDVNMVRELGPMGAVAFGLALRKAGDR